MIRKNYGIIKKVKKQSQLVLVLLIHRLLWWPKFFEALTALLKNNILHCLDVNTGFLFFPYMLIQFLSTDFLQFFHKHWLLFPPVCFVLHFLFSRRTVEFPILMLWCLHWSTQTFSLYNLSHFVYACTKFKHNWLETTNIICHTPRVGFPSWSFIILSIV